MSDKDLYPFWVKRAMKEVGQEEIPGPSSNERIVEYAKYTSLKSTDDQIPWCSSFMCWVFEEEHIPSPRSAAAIDWCEWGVKVDEPCLGCVVVMRRKGGNHVGLYVGENAGFYKILGGNQSDRVCIQSFPKALAIAFRMPFPEYYQTSAHMLDA